MALTVSFSTPAGVPGKPQKPVWGDVAGTSLKLSWVAPPNNGAEITGYRITYQESGTGGFFEKIKNTKSVAQAALITNLKTGGVAYQFKVQAYNKVGLGPASLASDPAQTQYSSTFATKKAVRLAHEQFKATHKLYTLRQLDTDRKLYRRRYLDTLQRYRIANERGQKSQLRVAQLMNRMNIESSLSGKKLALERDLAHKKVVLTDKIDRQTKKLNSKLSQRKLDDMAKLATERMLSQRKHYDKLLNKKQKKEDQLRDKIWKLNRQLQREKELRKAEKMRRKGAAAPRRLKDSAPSSSESKLKALFDAAANDAGAGAQLDEHIKQQHAVVVDAMKKAPALLKNSAFMMHPNEEKN